MTGEEAWPRGEEEEEVVGVRNSKSIQPSPADTKAVERKAGVDWWWITHPPPGEKEGQDFAGGAASFLGFLSFLSTDHSLSNNVAAVSMGGGK